MDSSKAVLYPIWMDLDGEILTIELGRAPATCNRG